MDMATVLMPSCNLQVGPQGREHRTAPKQATVWLSVKSAMKKDWVNSNPRL
jgi:hypothetical protein